MWYFIEMKNSLVLISLFIICSSATKYVPTRVVKWANGSFTIYNVAHGPNDYRDVPRTYEDMQKDDWLTPNHRTTIPIIYSSIVDTVGRGKPYVQFEFYNAACFYNRSYEESKVYRKIGLDKERDPCISYAEQYDPYSSIGLDETLDYMLRDTRMKGRYYAPLNNQPCVQDDLQLVKRSFDYEAYIEELQRYIVVAEDKINSEYYEIRHGEQIFFCRPRMYRQCSMEKNYFLGRCLILFAHHKGMNLL